MERQLCSKSSNLQDPEGIEFSKRSLQWRGFKVETAFCIGKNTLFLAYDSQFVSWRLYLFVYDFSSRSLIFFICCLFFFFVSFCSLLRTYTHTVSLSRALYLAFTLSLCPSLFDSLSSVCFTLSIPVSFLSPLLPSLSSYLRKTIISLISLHNFLFYGTLVTLTSSCAQRSE